MSFSAAVAGLVNERNKRSVWTVQTQPFRGAHFATFPEALAEVAIQAGSSERGCCPACGAPWRRVVRVDGRASVARATTPKGETRDAQKLRTPERLGHGPGWRQEPVAVATTLGWEPSCACPPADPAPCVVLDPFAGALTTNLVAARLGRDSIAIELKPEYAEIGKRRLLEEAPLLVTFDEGGA